MRGLSGDVFDCVILGGSTGVWWVEVKDAAKHTTAHKAASTAKTIQSKTSVVLMWEILL